MAVAATRRLPRSAAVPAQIFLGLAVGVLTWLLADEIGTALQRRLLVFVSPSLPAVLLAVLGLVSSGLMVRFPCALAGGAALLVAGIFIGLYFPENLPSAGTIQGDTLVVPEGAINVRLIAQRGAVNPAIHVLAGSWIALAGWGFYKGHGQSS